MVRPTDRPQTILVADDDQAIRFVLEQALSRAGFQVQCYAEGWQLLENLDAGDLAIVDIVMPSGSGLDLLKRIKQQKPRLPVIVITAQSTLRNAVSAFERGAFDYLAKPFDINKLVSLVKRALESLQEAGSARSRKENTETLLAASTDRFGGFIGSSRAMQEIFRTIGRLSTSEMTVLIHGESGTGKELIAKAVHAYSPRRSQPFLAINMGAIPQHLIESELFGHEKGAFTGAISRRIGHFERANNGTLFLDEIGDMPMEAQTRLLRVLQEGTFTRVGGSEHLHGNVRIIAATHQDLPAAISAGRFREDLFYRLNVIPLHVPSLRSRPEDIAVLADHFLAKTAKELSIPPKRLSHLAVEKLLAHHWPGNVRELENLIRRLMVLVPDDVVGADWIRFPEETTPAAPPASRREQSPAAVTPTRTSTIHDAVLLEVENLLQNHPRENLYDLVLQQVEAALLPRILQETRGNRLKAAALLGINRNTLRKKLQDIEASPRNSLPGNIDSA
ncbi:MAG: nitrogen regulation protein NR(I) [Magnetococcales bacterium]|nr:nitrogen regulation protein NR(I) [Magnetococcales bacterium]